MNGIFKKSRTLSSFHVNVKIKIPNHSTKLGIIQVVYKFIIKHKFEKDLFYVLFTNSPLSLD